MTRSRPPGLAKAVLLFHKDSYDALELNQTASVDLMLEREVRDAVFLYLRQEVDEHSVVSSAALRQFEFRGQHMHLASQQGIFKPRQLSLPISIRTAPPSTGREPPYPDRIDADHTLQYAYRGLDADFHENVGLRRLGETGLPLVYLHGVAKGRYLVSGALVVDDRPADLMFSVALTEIDTVTPGLTLSTFDQVQRTHQMRLVKTRVNQSSFRERVMSAYSESCALCRLRRVRLLDAAHIRPHAEGGESIVPNGLSLCKIHHAAFDAGILGVRPDLVAEIRPDVLLEKDGPMLAHGLQALHNAKLRAPRNASLRPDAEALEYRYEQFRSAS